NLEGIEVRHLVNSLFESIPGGVAQPEPPPTPLHAVGRAMLRSGLSRSAGGVGIIAPAITDTLHASFYLNALAIGRYCQEQWGTPESPLTSRFRYPLFVDPQIAQFFPPIRAEETDADQLGVTFQDLIERLSITVLPKDTFEEARTDNQWVFGGEMS